MFSRSTLLGGLAAALLLALPAVSDAQFRVGVGYGGYGRGVGVGYGGYGRGVGIGYGGYGYGGYGYNRYGYGLARPGFGVGLGYGTAYGGYPGYVNSAVAPNVVNQSFYPPQEGAPVDPAAASSGDGTALVVVTVPPNAEVWWNGTRSSQGGDSRRFRTAPLPADGAKQTFQARWSGPDGQPVTQSRDVQVTPNGTFTVNFNEQAQASPRPNTLSEPPQPLPTTPRPVQPE